MFDSKAINAYLVENQDTQKYHRLDSVSHVPIFKTQTHGCKIAKFVNGL